MPKILLIEDEDQHARLVRIRLESAGMEFASAHSAAEGVAAAAEQKPDLILMDLLLPDMKPEETIKALRAIPTAKKTPILAFTALDPREVQRRRLGTEISGLITKPYEPAELLRQIKKFVK